MNAAGKLLAILGPLMIVVGAIMGFSGANQASSDRLVAEYAATLGGGFYDSTAGASGDALMWAGIVIAILGALITIGVLFLAASRKTQPAAVKPVDESGDKSTLGA